jgi:hypothetical protein
VIASLSLFGYFLHRHAEEDKSSVTPFDGMDKEPAGKYSQHAPLRVFHSTDHMATLPRNSVSLAGEFAVLSNLALRGYDANLTLGNTKHVDILVSDPATRRMFQLEVKTKANSKPSNSKLFGNHLAWVMNKKHELIRDRRLYYCFVCLTSGSEPFRFFIVRSRVVAKYVKGQHQFWLRAKKSHKDTPMRMFRIGLDKGGYGIATPLASKYENKWSFGSP